MIGSVASALTFLTGNICIYNGINFWGDPFRLRWIKLIKFLVLLFLDAQNFGEASLGCGLVRGGGVGWKLGKERRRVSLSGGLGWVSWGLWQSHFDYSSHPRLIGVGSSSIACQRLKTTPPPHH